MRRSIFKYISPNMYGALLISLMAMLASVDGSIIHKLSQTYDATQILFIKSIIALSVVVILVNKNLVIKTNNLQWQLIRGGCAFVGITAFILAQTYLQMFEITVFSASSAIFTSLGASIFFREGVPLSRWIYILGAFFSVGIISFTQADITFNYLLILPLISAIAYSASSLIIKKIAVGDNSSTNLFYLLSILIVISAYPASQNWISPTTSDMVFFTALGIVSVIMQLCLIEAYSYAEASFIAPFKFIKYPVTLLAGVYIFHEEVRAQTIWGGIIILLVTILVLFSERKSSTPESRKEH